MAKAIYSGTHSFSLYNFDNSWERLPINRAWDSKVYFGYNKNKAFGRIFPGSGHHSDPSFFNLCYYATIFHNFNRFHNAKEFHVDQGLSISSWVLLVVSAKVRKRGYSVWCIKLVGKRKCQSPPRSSSLGNWPVICLYRYLGITQSFFAKEDYLRLWDGRVLRKDINTDWQ